MVAQSPGGAAALRRRFLSTDRAMIDRFGDPFRPLEPDCTVIQFDQPLTSAQLRQAADLIADRPDVELYVYGRASKDLDFLRGGLARSFIGVGGCLRDALFLVKMPIAFPRIV